MGRDWKDGNSESAAGLPARRWKLTYAGQLVTFDGCVCVCEHRGRQQRKGVRL